MLCPPPEGGGTPAPIRSRQRELADAPCSTASLHDPRFRVTVGPSPPP